MNGDIAPQFRTADTGNFSNGAVLYWTQAGTGAYLHPRALHFLASASQLDMREPEPGRWLPVREVAAEPPGFTRTRHPGARPARGGREEPEPE